MRYYFLPAVRRVSTDWSEKVTWAAEEICGENLWRKSAQAAVRDAEVLRPVTAAERRSREARATHLCCLFRIIAHKKQQARHRAGLPVQGMCTPVSF